MAAVSDAKGAGGTANPGGAARAAARLSALLDALPAVPKPVVQMVCEYLRRPPPRALILQIARQIDPKCLVPAHSSDIAGDSDTAAAAAAAVASFRYSDGNGEIRLFFSGRELAGLIGRDDLRMYPAAPKQALVEAHYTHRVLEQLLSLPDDDECAGALCAIEADGGLLLNMGFGRCIAFIAVPEGLSVADWTLMEVTGDSGVDGVPLERLIETTEPVCGLLSSYGCEI
jgi:hypothetical protein